MTDLMRPTPVAAAVVVARVPVMDNARAVVGFELVDRPAPEQDTGPPAETRPDEVPQVVTVPGLLGTVDANLSAVVGDKWLFCRVDRTLLLSETRLGLPPRRTVLEVPTRGLDEELLDSIRAYKQAGFTVMVAHDAETERPGELLALADLVKIDLGPLSQEEVVAVVDGYADMRVELVASGCDSEAQLLWAQAAGFTLYIGRVVHAPEAAGDSAQAPLPVSQVQLGIELLSEDLDLDRIEDVLRGDPALVLQLLNMASAGAAGGLRRQVRSLREALVVMGTARIRQWAAVVILSRHSQRRSDALVTTLVRARMCELIARSRGIEGAFAFTAGLLSGLSTLLGVPDVEIEHQIEADEDLINAAFRREGAVGQLITRVEAHEKWQPGAPTPDDHDVITMIGAMAFGWAASYAEAVDSAA